VSPAAALLAVVLSSASALGGLAGGAPASAASAAAAASDPGAAVEYRVSVANREHHEARIEVVFPGAPDPLDVRMSRSSPGRYALHEFAKNVYSVEARDAGGRELAIERPDPHGWRVSGHGAGEAVSFSYTLFGDLVDGTYAGIDESHAHLNAPATFVWARELAERPVRVSFPDLPPGWRVSSQLPRAAAPGEAVAAPDLWYLLDSPIEASDHEIYEWDVPGPAAAPERRQTVRLAIHHLGTEQEARAFVELAKAVVAEEIALFGEPPRFDHGTYTFLADYLPWADGDGMEHRNSTVLTSSRSLRDGAVGNLGTVAHELVHAWSIERLRPRTLEPFDFERENPSGELWFGEGFTSYYDDLVLARAGVISFERFVERLSSLVSAVTTTPARAYGGPAAMSERASFVDAASWVDPTNDANTFLSYYTYGAAIGLALDLELRARGSTLDDFMAAMWRRHGRSESGYSNDDLRQMLAETTEEPRFAEEFFARFVLGSELPDYQRLLSSVGLVLRPSHSGRAWLGDAPLRFSDDGAELTASTRVGDPLYEADIDRGDVLLRIDGELPASEAWLRDLLAERSPGDELRVVVRGRGATSEVAVVLREDPAVEVVSFESAGRALDASASRSRQAWLRARAEPRPELRRYCPKDGAAFPFAYEHCPWDGEPLSLVPPAAASP
jgi:predicted metalloprotease with PDZ domain